MILLKKSPGSDVLVIRENPACVVVVGADGYAQANAQAQAVLNETGIENAIARVGALIDEIREIKLASRFSTTRKVRDNLGLPVGEPYVAAGLVDPTEEELKRMQLRMDASAVQSKLAGVQDSLKRLLMDVYASQTEW